APSRRRGPSPRRRRAARAGQRRFAVGQRARSLRQRRGPSRGARDRRVPHPDLDRLLAAGSRRDRPATARGAAGRPGRGGRLDVPTGTYYGDADHECAFTLGRTVPFDSATLTALYPTHDGYVTSVNDASATAVARGWLLPVDATEIEAAAAASGIGG